MVQGVWFVKFKASKLSQPFAKPIIFYNGSLQDKNIISLFIIFKLILF